MESPKKSRKWYLRKVNEMAGHSSKYQKDYQNKQNTAHKSNINTHRATRTHRYTAHSTHIHSSTHNSTAHIRTHSTAVCNTLAIPACRPVGTAYAIQKWSPPSQPNSPTTPMVAHTVLNRFPQFSTFRNTIKKDVTVVTTGIVQILSAI